MNRYLKNFGSIYYKEYGTNNFEFISRLKNTGVIKSDLAFKAMKLVDRKYYCREGTDPYFDSPQPIGFGATVSAPHMHAYAIKLMEPIIKKKDGNVKVLDVGSGSGIFCSYIAQLLGKEGKVFGLEIVPHLVKQSIKNIKSDPNSSQLLESKKINILEGDGWQGLQKEAPFDLIHVGAAAAKLPQNLVDQLAIGGILVIPVGVYDQSFMKITKLKNGKIKKQNVCGVR